MALEREGIVTHAAEPTRTADPRGFFSEKHATYERFIRVVRYPQGLRAFFDAFPALRSGMRVLDAGCGTGVVTLALRDAMLRRGLAPGALDAFDLTPAMLERFRLTRARRGIEDVRAVEADVLTLDALPADWTGYDLVVSASMLEYVPRAHFVDALAALRGRLGRDGRFVLFVTRRNWLTRPLIGRWWRSNVYDARELRAALTAAGFATCAFGRFPLAGLHLALWGHVVEATR